MNIALKSHSNKVGIVATATVIVLLSLLIPQRSLGARLKDISSIKGVRENILIGYGIVVGLKGTGDSSVDVTSQSLGKLFGKLGLEMAKDAQVKSKNAAAVIVTAKLPPFSRVGNKIDITVSSIGDASSLEGGILLVTPLRAGDQAVYAVAQGAVTIGAPIDGKSEKFPTVGRVVAGATIEKDVDFNFASKKNFRLSLREADFTTVTRVVATINQELGGKFATARDSGTIDVVVPFGYENNAIEMLARIENLNVNTDTMAKVILNERTGTIVIGQNVTITPVAISHGDLAIDIQNPQDRALAAAPAGGGGNDKNKKKDRVLEISKQTTVSDLVKALNQLGVQPKDMTAIFQTLKKIGALQAELEFM
jgi:flagellar P-ring protein precursor FlgI